MRHTVFSGHYGLHAWGGVVVFYGIADFQEPWGPSGIKHRLVRTSSSES